MDAKGLSKLINDELQLLPATIADNYNSFCRVLELLRRNSLDGPAGAIVAEIYAQAKQMAVFEFAAKQYQDALAYARDERPGIELFYPPTMPFDTCLLVDDISCALFYDAQDFDIGTHMADAHDSLALKGEVPPGSAYEPWLLRSGKVVSFFSSFSEAAGVSVWVLTVSDFSFLAPIPGKNKWTIAYSQPWVLSGFSNTEDITVRPPGYTEGKNPDRLDSRIYDTGYKHMEQAINTGLEQLSYIDLPRHHVVREERQLTARQQRQLAGGTHLPRHTEVVKYRVVAPEAVRTLYPGDGEGAVGPRTQVPHGRRGYTRYLSDARFTNKRWTRIKVKPSWVGAEEWEYNKLRYRVIRPSGEEATA